MRALFLALAALVLMGTLVELSCVANERSHVQPSAAPARLFSPPPSVDPPTMSETDAGEAAEIAVSPALTR